MKHTSTKSSIIYTLAVPVLSALFVLIYRPFNLYPFLDMSDGLFFSNVAVMGVITIVVLGLMRLLLHLGLKKRINTTRRFIGWCMLEILVSALAVSTYIYLIFNDINDILYSLGAFIAVVAIPYLIVYLFIELYLQKINSTDVKPTKVPATKDGLIIEFKGETSGSNIDLMAEDIVYIHSVENYVHIYHYNGTEIAHTQIRATMNGVESMVSVCKQIRRAHRSYIINVMLLDKVIKDKKGNYFAVMKDNTELPVSKKYLDHFIEEVPPWKLPDIDLNKILTHHNE
ncbi:MAG: LytTR family transcriptional regulator [Bacteroidales bacterium]|nr:LytTR family transcriptional regulator [Bacteroidales bacterium]